MLIATITALILLLGSGGKYFLFDIKDPVKEHVQDKDKRGQILDIAKAGNKEVEAFDEYAKKLAEELLDVGKRSDATPEELQALIDKALNRRFEAQGKIIDARFAMKDLMTKEEWEAVFPPSHDGYLDYGVNTRN